MTLHVPIAEHIFAEGPFFRKSKRRQGDSDDSRQQRGGPHVETSTTSGDERGASSPLISRRAAEVAQLVPELLWTYTVG